MTWRIRYTRTFLKEMARLPENVRARAENVSFGEEIKQDPFLGGKVQKLSGYNAYYKFRIGDYRIGLQPAGTQPLRPHALRYAGECRRVDPPLATADNWQPVAGSQSNFTVNDDA